MNESTAQLHITSGNCFAAFRRLGFHKTPVGTSCLCGVLLQHILRLLVLLRKPLFATAKRQLPRTLGASFLNWFENYIIKDT